MKGLIFYKLVAVLLPLCNCKTEYISDTQLFEDVDRQYQLASFTNIVADSRYLDLVFTDSTHQDILVRSKAKNNTYYQPEGYKFTFRGDANVSDMKIIGVLPADFNHDKSTDIMVVFSKEGGVEYRLAILWNIKNEFTEPTHINETFSGVPLLLDYNGDLFVDFICSQQGAIYFWINEKIPIGVFRKLEVSSTDKDNDIEINEGETLYAYGDLNGDCAADLFMITKLKNGSSIFEIYLAQEKKLVKTNTVIPAVIADKYGAPLMQDMDGNGKMDIVIPSCSAIDKNTNTCGESKIVILYNGPCHTNTAEECPLHMNNCEEFELKFEKYEFNKFEHNNMKYGFLSYDMKKDIYDSKFMLRAADVDSDGLIDLVGILNYQNSHQQSVIFTNIVDASENIGGRSFNPTWRDDLVLNSDQTATYEPYAVAPVDALGKGTVQFFIIGRKPNDPKDFSLTFLAPKDMLDMFWLKVSVLCYKCENSSTTTIGANFFYFTTGLTGKDQVGYMSQSTSLTSFSLQAPYMLFGLGQQANYIEYIRVAYRNTNISQQKTVDKYQFDQLVPNAQVFAIPLESMWRLVLMIVPGKTMWQTLLVLGICCLVCIIIILILHIKEKKEDEREKRKFNAKFNFDAM